MVWLSSIEVVRGLQTLHYKGDSRWEKNARKALLMEHDRLAFPHKLQYQESAGRT